MIRIAIDAMGGDFGPEPIIEGVIQALDERQFLPILVGDRDQIISFLPEYYLNEVEIINSSDVIAMSDQATQALKRKESTIYRAVELVRDGKAAAVVSAGHSGATMTLATLRIGRLPHISKPALATLMPNKLVGAKTLLLDVGAVTDCTAKNLYQFAIMGEVYAQKVLKLRNPKVGLLSNGEEDSKGNALTKEAFKLMKDVPGFKGNVEGSDIFNGSVDVVVCDGYTGNIVLKASEGVVSTVFDLMKTQIRKSIPAKIGAFMMKKKVFKKLKEKVDYAEYGGAPLLGVKGCVIISHGKSNAKAIKNAIFQAMDYNDNDVNTEIEALLTKNNA
ncbi:MAG TPA: phosphate acyltransferase PlsX [Sulfurovum sp.]|nr:phosphate acyltransferase PlsX [Sulfurovum sp.]